MANGPSCQLPLCWLRAWGPFHIDALGLLTLLGAEEVDAAIGSLVSSRYTEYLPLLAAFVIANNKFTESKPGFTLYNLTAGITTTDMAGWFQRWCTAQGFAKAGGSVRWTVAHEARFSGRQWCNRLTALFIGVMLNSFMIVFTALQCDWWGLGNAVSMVLSISVRAYLTEQNRRGLDAAARLHARSNNQELFLVVLNDSRMISMTAPQGIVLDCFVKKPRPLRPRLYFFARMIGWLAFATQVIAIGMSSFATQIITVVVMSVSTALTVFRKGCEEFMIGSALQASLTSQRPGSDSRKDAYIALGLDTHQLDALKAWNLVPLRNGTPTTERWWNDFEERPRTRD
ncbi:hypothetical protein EDB80DRAFT_360869 [Ilyonectria destructans]|nr:hypothetical protein EDB80DRAFT_360869 [Ilyonectria destructans]